MVRADMGGSLFVAEVELNGRRFKLDNQPNKTPFLELPFDEAVDFFAARFGDESRAMEVIRKYRKIANKASRRTLENIARNMVASLDRTLRDGGTMADFISEFESATFQAGYLENVFRTNIQTAYGAGRVTEIENAADYIPYVEYVTAGDSRVRAEHEALNGKVWRTDDPEWRDFAPPNGYQCRCAIVTREGDDFEKDQLTRKADRGDIEEGFFGPPTQYLDEQL